MSAGIHNWLLELEFDPDAADSSHTAEIAGSPVALVSAVSGYAVKVFVVSVFVVAELAVCFDAVCAGLRQRPTAQV